MQPKILNDQIDAFSETATPTTGAFQLPVGTTAERPASPADGMVRFNTDIDHNEVYRGLSSGWFAVPDSIHGTATINFGSLSANGGTETQTATVTGAATTDYAFVTTNGAPAAGILYQAWVSAADQVSIRATNTTNGAIDPASQGFLIIVFKA
jgi:hypothetical protein